MRVAGDPPGAVRAAPCGSRSRIGPVGLLLVVASPRSAGWTVDEVNLAVRKYFLDASGHVMIAAANVVSGCPADFRLLGRRGSHRLL